MSGAVTDSRFVLLHALATYHAVLPEGIPVRALNGRIDAVERCMLTASELDDAVAFLTSRGLAEEVDGRLRLTSRMATSVPLAADGRPSRDRAAWPALK